LKLKALLVLGLLVLSNSANAEFAPLDMESGMKVPLTSPANRVLPRKSGFAAQMYWSKEPHTRNLNDVIVSAVFKDEALKVEEVENLLPFMTDLVDKGMRITTIEKTPYREVKEKAKSYSNLSTEIQKHDVGMLFYIDNQKNGEVGLHVFLRDTMSGEVFGHYTARIRYDMGKGMEAKKAAVVHGIAVFAREFNKFREGNREVSETIYNLE